MLLLKIGGVIGFFVIILIVIFTYNRLFSKTSENYFRKARNSHKKGEEYFNLGESELAEEYYEQANQYRKDGEELKNVVWGIKS